MRRSWLVAAIIVVIIAVVAAVVIAKSKDDSSGKPDAAAWANSVCTSVSDWKSSITSLADVSGGSLTKDSLQQKLDDADTATQQLVSDLKDLGPPDLTAGDQLKQQLNADADSLQSSYDLLKSKAQDATNASSASAFLSALAALAPPFQDLVNQINTTLDDLRNANVGADAKAELQAAFDDSASCQSLKSGQD
jgi:septation ring formation regulator EzrA